jgi:phenylacetate-CoA ligase
MSSEGGLQRQFYEMLMESQWWSPGQLQAYQRSQLGQLLRHAKKHVPFYEHRLDAVVKNNGDIDWDRWSEIPIVKREDLRDHGEAMLARELPAGHGPIGTSNSSGSTGVPITVTTTALAHLARTAQRWRSDRRHDLDWARIIVNRLGDVEGPKDWPQGTPRGPWGPSWDESSRRGFWWSLNLSTTNEQVLDFIERRGCTYLIAGPKTAHMLALESIRLKRPTRLDAIMVQSNRRTEDDRQICRSTFGASMIELYSSKEGGNMAYSCTHGRLHVDAEVLLLEILDDAGREVAPGETGRVVITPFLSSAQPLVRYEQGDLARKGTGCACGLCLPVIDEIIGRSLAIFRHPDGRSAVAIMPNSARELLDCEFWQMAQVGPNHYEVRYVPRSSAVAPDEGAFAALFRSVFFEDSVVEFRRVEGIPLTRAGKLVEYVNEWYRQLA